jgi:hypothetical protein
MQFVFPAGGALSAADTSHGAAMAAITINLVVPASIVQAAGKKAGIGLLSSAAALLGFADCNLGCAQPGPFA